MCVESPKTCPACNGKGALEYSFFVVGFIRCPDCKGSGKIPVPESYLKSMEWETDGCVILSDDTGETTEYVWF